MRFDLPDFKDPVEKCLGQRVEAGIPRPSAAGPTPVRVRPNRRPRAPPCWRRKASYLASTRRMMIGAPGQARTASANRHRHCGHGGHSYTEGADLALQALQGRAENRQQTHYLSVPAAGQYCNQQLIRREPMRGPKPPPITAVGPALEHRVAHIATGQPDPSKYGGSNGSKVSK